MHVSGKKTVLINERQLKETSSLDKSDISRGQCEM